MYLFWSTCCQWRTQGERRNFLFSWKIADFSPCVARIHISLDDHFQPFRATMSILWSFHSWFLAPFLYIRHCLSFCFRIRPGRHVHSAAPNVRPVPAGHGIQGSPEQWQTTLLPLDSPGRLRYRCGYVAVFFSYVRCILQCEIWNYKNYQISRKKMSLQSTVDRGVRRAECLPKFQFNSLFPTIMCNYRSILSRTLHDVKRNRACKRGELQRALPRRDDVTALRPTTLLHLRRAYDSPVHVARPNRSTDCAPTSAQCVCETVSYEICECRESVVL